MDASGTDAFFVSLIEGLENLERSTGARITFSFLTSGVEFLIAMNVAVLLLMENLHLPVCEEQKRWKLQYMEESVKLSETCSMLQSGITRLENFINLIANRVLLNFRNQGARWILNIDIRDAKDEIQGLENEHIARFQTWIEVAAKKLSAAQEDQPKKRAKTVQEEEHPEWKGFWVVWFAVQKVNSYLCRLLLSALVYSGPVPAPAPELEFVEPPWLCALSLFHSGIAYKVNNNRRNRVKCCLAEIQSLEALLESVRLELVPVNQKFDAEKFANLTRSLIQCCTEFDMGAPLSVKCAINELTIELADGREKFFHRWDGA